MLPLPTRINIDPKFFIMKSVEDEPFLQEKGRSSTFIFFTEKYSL